MDLLVTPDQGLGSGETGVEDTAPGRLEVTAVNSVTCPGTWPALGIAGGAGILGRHSS